MHNRAPHAGAVLFAKDMERVAMFYERLFSMHPRRREVDHVVLQLDGFELTVHAIPAHIAATFTIATPPARREDSAVKLSLRVAALAEARVIATSLGGAIDPMEREWMYDGRRVCDGVDPEGNVVQAWEMSR